MTKMLQDELSYESSLRPGEIHHDLKVTCIPGAAWIEIWGGEGFFSITHLKDDVNLVVTSYAGDISSKVQRIKANDLVDYLIKQSHIEPSIKAKNWPEAGNTRLNLKVALNLLFSVQV